METCKIKKGRRIMHCGYVVRVEKMRKHPNADRLQIATFFGNDTCVSTDVEYGEVGIYFPSDLQLSVEYCDANHLCRKDANGMPDSGYLEREKRHIKAINLRGEKSDGIYMPLNSLSFTGINAFEFNIGDTITVVNGIEICKKYIPRGRKSYAENGTPKAKKNRASIAPLFSEHADTEQLAYNLSAFKPGDEIEITLKMHGTSQRTAYLPVLKGYKRTLWDRITRKEGTPIYDYDYVSGTRRTILNDYEGGFYGSNKFRAQHHNQFIGKLMKGEEVFYEVVSYTDTGTPIMGSVSVPKEYQTQYGKTMEFHYGNEKPNSDIYVYRMSFTNEDGYSIDYSPYYTQYRCEQMGVKYVPVFWYGIIPEHPASKEDDTITAGEWIKNKAEDFYDGPDSVGKTHVREGVVVKIINRPKFTAYKHKNHLFKVLSGIIAEKAEDNTENISEDILSEL